MNAQDLFEEVVHRAEQLVGHRQPRTGPDTDEDRYVAQSGSSWTVEELTALARESLVEDTDD
jgi:hypothetical protein